MRADANDEKVERAFRSQEFVLDVSMAADADPLAVADAIHNYLCDEDCIADVESYDAVEPGESEAVRGLTASDWMATASDMNAEFQRAMEALAWLCFQNCEEVLSGPRGDGQPGPHVDGRFGWTQIPERFRDLIEAAAEEAESAYDEDEERAKFDAWVPVTGGSGDSDV